MRTARGPVEFVFVGSITAEVPIPGLNPYGASKAFLRQLSLAISADEQFRLPTNVTTSYLRVGGVATNNRGTPSLFEPAAADFAKSLVAKIGGGRSELAPWFWHAVQFWGLELLPESVIRKMLQDTTAKEWDIRYCGDTTQKQRIALYREVHSEGSLCTHVIMLYTRNKSLVVLYRERI